MNTLLKCQKTSVFLVAFIALCAITEVAQAQQSHFAYPPYGAQRGRMVHRDGLWHSERYRWGNGLTPQGAAFLTHAVDAFAPAVVGLVGANREIDDGSGNANRNANNRDNSPMGATRGQSLTDVWNDYKVAQEEANALLRRTAALLGDDVKAPGPSPSTSPNFLAKPSPSEAQEKFGSNPWKQ